MLVGANISASFILEVVGAVTDDQVAAVGGERAAMWMSSTRSVRESFCPLHHIECRLWHRLWWHLSWLRPRRQSLGEHCWDYRLARTCT
jgi:hypothetical protein